MGNIYIIGGSELALNESPLMGEQDIFIAKLDSSGNLKWVRQIGVAAKVAVGNCIRVDDSGHVYISGVLTGALDNEGVSSEEMFVAKYDSEGSFQWIRQMEVTGRISSSISEINETSGNVYVCGEVSGLNPEVFISKITGSGILQWIRQIRIGATV